MNANWKFHHLLAKEAGFCSIDPEGNPHLERPDGDDLQKFVQLIIDMDDGTNLCAILKNKIS
jgi:hypothetical protein